MNAELQVQLQLGDPPKVLLQNRGLHLKLVLVTCVLIVAAAAALKIRAQRLDAVGGFLHHLLHARAHKARLLFNQRGVYLFAWQNEGYEHPLSGAKFIGGQTSQPIPSIHEFFDGEIQGMILCQQINAAGNGNPRAWRFKGRTS